MGNCFTLVFTASGIELDALASLGRFTLLKVTVIAQASPAVGNIHSIFTVRHTKPRSSNIAHTTFKHWRRKEEQVRN